MIAGELQLGLAEAFTSASIWMTTTWSRCGSDGTLLLGMSGGLRSDLVDRPMPSSDRPTNTANQLPPLPCNDSACSPEGVDRT